MTLFLLDANLSPKIARFLQTHFDLDIVSIQRQRLGELPDHEVIKLARSTKRVVITLDRDYPEFFFRTRNPGIGVIYLDIPNELRRIPDVNRLLSEFFTLHASSIDLELSLVILTATEVRIHHR
jgi:predicted nuclease of predicted toxin-antitoxin system